MYLIAIITEYEFILFYLMRLIYLIRLYVAIMVNIKFYILFKPINGIES